MKADVGLLAAFEACAGRFRRAGLFLALVDRGGKVIHHDENAEPGLTAEGLKLLRGEVNGAEAGLRSLAYFLPETGELGASVAMVARSAEVPGDRMMELGGIVRGAMVDRHEAQAVGTRLDALTSHLAETYEELALLYQVSSGMKVNRSPEEFFRPLCADIRSVLDARVVGVAIRRGHCRENSLVVQGDMALDPVRLSRFADETTERLVDHRQAVVCNDLGSDPGMSFLWPAWRGLMLVPLVRDDAVLGFVFAVDRVGGAPFTGTDAKLVSTVAAAAAVYCENSLLYENMQGLMMGLLRALSAAVDAKDSYTCGHSERVARYARALAGRVGLTAEECDRVYIAGLLHDVGKIGVPESVLQKPLALTAEEFAHMRRHPEVGARILADIRQLQDIIPGVLHHHERWDGNGYPHRVAGEQIPLVGRILCVADSFDAMTSDRTYRKGMALELALEDVRVKGGSQFDPRLAAAFLGMDIPELVAGATAAAAAPRSQLLKAVRVAA